MSIFNGLKEIAREGKVSLHMPGHKNGRFLAKKYGNDFFAMDLTEVPGADNLHYPTGIIKETMIKIAHYNESKGSFLSVNGSTGAMYAAIFTALKPNEEVLVQRNAHKSIYNGLLLRGARATYVYAPKDDYQISGTLTLEAVKEAIERLPRAKGLIMTSPTYYGHIAPIEEIATYLHERNMFLIVDEAHGAHFPMLPGIKSAAASGADLSVQSFHKTMPAFTQSACLHRGTDRFAMPLIQRMMNLFQTTSPSYLLMSSMDLAVDIAMAEGQTAMKDLLGALEDFRKQFESHPSLRVYEPMGLKDPTRLVLVAKQDLIDFYQLEKDLQKEGFQAEFSFEEGIVLLFSFSNTKEEVNQLLKALNTITIVKRARKSATLPSPEAYCDASKALLLKQRLVTIEEAVGHVNGQMIIPYPPGIPLLVPGEIITEEIVAFIKENIGKIEFLGVEDHQYLAIAEV